MRALRYIRIAFAATSVPLASTSAQTAELGLYYEAVFHRKGEEAAGSLLYAQGYKALTERLGVWGFAAGEQGYFSTVLGGYYDLVPSRLNVGIAGGFERFSSEGNWKSFGRVASSVWLGSERAYIELYFENGASRDWWYQLDAMWRFREWLGLGVLGQRYVGIGPRILFAIPGIPIELWAAPAVYERGESRPNRVIGAQVFYRTGGGADPSSLTRSGERPLTHR